MYCIPSRHIPNSQSNHDLTKVTKFQKPDAESPLSVFTTSASPLLDFISTHPTLSLSHTNSSHRPSQWAPVTLGQSPIYIIPKDDPKEEKMVLTQTTLALWNLLSPLLTKTTTSTLSVITSKTTTFFVSLSGSFVLFLISIAYIDPTNWPSLSHYDILGVNVWSSRQGIDVAANRTLTRLLVDQKHRHKPRERVVEEWLAAVEAYSTIIDPVKRCEYHRDTGLPDWFGVPMFACLDEKILRGVCGFRGRVYDWAGISAGGRGCQGYDPEETGGGRAVVVDIRLPEFQALPEIGPTETGEEETKRVEVTLMKRILGYLLGWLYYVVGFLFWPFRLLVKVMYFDPLGLGELVESISRAFRNLLCLMVCDVPAPEFRERYYRRIYCGDDGAEGSGGGAAPRPDFATMTTTAEALMESPSVMAEPPVLAYSAVDADHWRYWAFAPDPNLSPIDFTGVRTLLKPRIRRGKEVVDGVRGELGDRFTEVRDWVGDARRMMGDAWVKVKTWMDTSAPLVIRESFGKTAEWAVGVLLLPLAIPVGIYGAFVKVSDWLIDNLETPEAIRNSFARAKRWVQDPEVPESIGAFITQLRDDTNAIPSLLRDKYEYLKEWTGVADVSWAAFKDSAKGLWDESLDEVKDLGGYPRRVWQALVDFEDIVQHDLRKVAAGIREFEWREYLPRRRHPRTRSRASKIWTKHISPWFNSTITTGLLASIYPSQWGSWIPSWRNRSEKIDGELFDKYIPSDAAGPPSGIKIEPVTVGEDLPGPSGVTTEELGEILREPSSLVTEPVISSAFEPVPQPKRKVKKLEPVISSAFERVPQPKPNAKKPEPEPVLEEDEIPETPSVEETRPESSSRGPGAWERFTSRFRSPESESIPVETGVDDQSEEHIDLYPEETDVPPLESDDEILESSQEEPEPTSRGAGVWERLGSFLRPTSSEKIPVDPGYTSIPADLDDSELPETSLHPPLSSDEAGESSLADEVPPEFTSQPPGFWERVGSFFQPSSFEPAPVETDYVPKPGDDESLEPLETDYSLPEESDHAEVPEPPLAQPESTSTAPGFWERVGSFLRPSSSEPEQVETSYTPEDIPIAPESRHTDLSPPHQSGLGKSKRRVKPKSKSKAQSPFKPQQSSKDKPKPEPVPEPPKSVGRSKKKMAEHRPMVDWAKVSKAREERLREERLRKARLREERLQEERLQEERLQEERLQEERLREERLQAERLRKEQLRGEQLQKERLREERLREERLREERLREERLREAKGKQERLREERLRQEELLRGERLREERLCEERLHEFKREQDRLREAKQQQERIPEEEIPTTRHGAGKKDTSTPGKRAQEHKSKGIPPSEVPPREERPSPGSMPEQPDTTTQEEEEILRKKVCVDGEWKIAPVREQRPCETIVVCRERGRQWRGPPAAEKPVIQHRLMETYRAWRAGTHPGFTWSERSRSRGRGYREVYREAERYQYEPREEEEEQEEWYRNPGKGDRPAGKVKQD
ncbi:hypothetical protein QBC35DRAFT_553493 [Podospora australis]|uniref:Uncharacterized protein n=1 Tax=Podospora australis TaxID=1536484 RepID=A0AAN7AHE0_9PEZI|nr:hypothetical protein QBC35DRAFT_553493 [Podospora australis]